MTKQAYLMLLCAVIAIGMMISPAMAIETAPGGGIYCLLDKAQEHPDIDDNMIVWEDDRNGHKDIYFGTVDKFEADRYRGNQYVSYSGERITYNSASQEKPSISGDYIVWQDNRHGSWDIYLYHRPTYEEKRLTDDTGNQWMPIICGNYVAWYDDSSGRTNVVLYDIVAGKVKATIDCNAHIRIPGETTTTEFKPALSEKYVAWIEESDRRVHYYDIATGKRMGPVSTSTAEQSWPSLYGSVIAWEDYRHAGTRPDIYMADLDDPSRKEILITDADNDQVSPTIGENIIAWEDKRGAPDSVRSIYMYDLSREREMPVVLSVDKYDELLYPAVSGNTIVWQRGHGANSNLYIFVYDPEELDAKVTTIEVTPPTPTLAINDTNQFSATVFDQNGDDMSGVAVTWASSNTTVGSIDEHGLFTALVGGTTTVTASAGDISGAATVTVTDEEPVEPELTTITVNPSTATLAISDTERFSAIAFDENGDDIPGVAVTWASSNATVGTIDPSTGLFTALVGGTTTVTASAGDISGAATVTVTDEEPVEPELTTITVSPSTPTLAINDTEQFSAIAFDENGDDMPGVAVTWASNDTTVGSIDEHGLFTALAAGTTIVTASAGDISGTATVVVSDEEPVEPVVVCVEVYPSPVTLDIGDTNQFSATAFDQDDSVVDGVEFGWSCSGGDVGTIDEYGLFTAFAAGTTTVTATVDGISGTADVTVNADEPALARIVVIPSAATIEVGGDLEYRAVAFDRFGNLVPDADIDWECCNEEIGSIDESGFFTALSSGTATITACGDGAKGSATVTVNCNAPTLDRIVVVPPAITLAEGDTAAFTAIAFDQDGIEMPDVEVAWGCDNTVVGEIDESGFFTALAAGTTTVTATAEGIPGAAEVTVTGEPATLTISPSDIILSIGDKWQFTLYGLQENVSSSAVSWSCDDLDVGIINPSTGLFIAQGEGSTTIIAKIDETDETVTATVTVLSILSPGPARIEVSPSDFFIPAGETFLLTATVYDRHGYPMDIVVEWESCDEDVGTIDEHGLFTALNGGEVRLIASADGVYASACVTVEPSIPVPACIEIDPDTATLAPGETREFIATVFDQCDDVMDWVRVAWSCPDDHVGTIDRSGTFAALAQGSTGVTACAGGIEGTASVTVMAATTPDPTPSPTSSPQSGSWSGGADTSGPSFSAGICEGLNGGETHTFSCTTTSIDSIAVTALSNIPRLLLTVKETGCPGQAQSPGDAYEYIEIETSWVNPDQIAGAVVTFTIPAKWFDEHGILPEDIRLMRYVDGGWQILTTEVIGEENGLYRFRATTPGFSTFAIAAAPENVTTPVETITAVTNVTTGATEEPTTAATTVPVTTTPTTPLVYAPFLAPLAFLLWRRKNN